METKVPSSNTNGTWKQYKSNSVLMCETNDDIINVFLTIGWHKKHGTKLGKLSKSIHDIVYNNLNEQK